LVVGQGRHVRLLHDAYNAPTDLRNPDMIALLIVPLVQRALAQR
jgi:hypothetical protein